MGKVEIIPPSRSGLPAHRTDQAVMPAGPRVNPGGIVSSALMRWEANRHARTLGAVAARTRAEADLFDAQTQAMESYVKRQRAGARVQELPEIIATDRAQRRAERAEELRALRHQHDMAETRRMTETAHAERVLVDAQQALRAQRDFGYRSYELEWKKRSCEILDVELNAAERRAILREHLAELGQAPEAPRVLSADSRDEEIDEALHEARSQLRASGLDTAKIDTVLARRAGNNEA
jgi:hypothetical protein